ncbi:hypothetical protein [Micromonospora sp. A200]|uniref:hypothetical protein n=1 Tax=Micromonospora sp. A200 TaxID=2940568 RepID=UPI0024741F04|nr:hypothetical protein [Micromonospora sp. A200]
MFSISAAIVLYTVDAELHFDVNRGAYAILVSFFIAGYCGWLSRSAERRMRRVAVGELRQMAAAVDELREQVARQRTVYLPTPRQHEGHRYVGAVAVGAEDDTTHASGIDPASIDALRRINTRLRSVDHE